MERCKICTRKNITEYCEYHQKAYENLRQKYVHWRTAVKISWPKYLQEIIVNPNTGLWAKEVAEYLISLE